MSEPTALICTVGAVWRLIASPTGYRQGSLIAEIDYHPGGRFNQPFVVIEDWTPDGQDLCIINPRNGSYTRLRQRYARDDWTLRRAEELPSFSIATNTSGIIFQEWRLSSMYHKGPQGSEGSHE